MLDLIPFDFNNTSVLGESFKDFFEDDFFKMTPSTKMNQFEFDVKENNDSYMVNAKLPGVDKANIDLRYDDDNLYIMVNKENNYEDKKDNYFTKSSCINRFARSVYLGNVDKTKIRAKFDDGTLKVLLPKKEANKFDNKINIE